MIDRARTLHVWALWLFLALVLVQFFLAGLGVFGGRIQYHEDFGWAVLHTLVPVLILLTAALGRMGWKHVGLVLLWYVLLTVQILVVTQNGTTPEVAALHPALALIVIGYVYLVLLRRARAPRVAPGQS